MIINDVFREIRKAFIRGKYISRKYVVQTCAGDTESLAEELGQTIQSSDLAALLQLYGENADLCMPLPGYVSMISPFFQLLLVLSYGVGLGLYSFDIVINKLLMLNIYIVFTLHVQFSLFSFLCFCIIWNTKDFNRYDVKCMIKSFILQFILYIGRQFYA